MKNIDKNCKQAILIVLGGMLIALIAVTIAYFRFGPELTPFTLPIIYAISVISSLVTQNKSDKNK
jgi:hypothetical protein